MAGSKNKVLRSRVPLFLVWIRDSLSIFWAFLSRRRKLTGPLEKESPFFIIGCGRSGNTLLRSILMAGEEVAIPPESYVWPRVIRRYRAFSFLPWELISSLIVSEFESYKEFYTWEISLDQAHQRARTLPKNQRTLAHILDVIYETFKTQKGLENRRWGDKTPINTIYADKILKVFPNAQFVYIERDPRDVVCSYVKAGLYSDFEAPARFWRACKDTSLKLKSQLPDSQFLTISYEDLVRDPVMQTKRVCEFLDLHYRDNMMDFWKETSNLGDVNYAAHHHNVKSPISSDSIGRWKKVLSTEERHMVERITGIKQTD